MGGVRRPGQMAEGAPRLPAPLAQPQAAPAPPAAPPGRGFPGRAGPFHPGSESDVGVNENKRGARGEGRRARRRKRCGAGGSCRAAEARAGGRPRSRVCCGCRGSPRDVRARAGRSPSCTRRPPPRPLRAATYQRRARGAGGWVRAGGAQGGARRAGRGCPGSGLTPSSPPAPGQEDARRRALKHGGGSVQVDQLSYRYEHLGGPRRGGQRGEGLGGLRRGGCGEGRLGAPPPSAWPAVTLTANRLCLVPRLNPFLCPLLGLIWLEKGTVGDCAPY